jgi:ubiquinone/menaquinone biosynthesis C-methylase UbiE
MDNENIFIKNILQGMPLKDYFEAKNKYGKYYTTGTQILTVIKKGRILDYGNLLSLLLYFISNPNYKKSIIELLNVVEQYNKDDAWFYNSVSKLMINNVNKIYERDIAHIKQHAFFINKYSGEIKNGNYLDIGCGDGNQTIMLGQLLGFNQNCVMGTDIQCWDEKFTVNKQLNFKPIIKGKLAYESCSLSLVTAFSVLHHVKDLELLLAEIYRCLAMNGLFVIREHDAYDDSDKLLADIEHAMYALLHGKTGNTCGTGYANYFCKIEWIQIIERIGFKILLLENIVKIPRGDYKVTKPFIAIFKK